MGMGYMETQGAEEVLLMQVVAAVLVRLEQQGVLKGLLGGLAFMEP